MTSAAAQLHMDAATAHEKLHDLIYAQSQHQFDLSESELNDRIITEAHAREATDKAIGASPKSARRRFWTATPGSATIIERHKLAAREERYAP